MFKFVPDKFVAPCFLLLKQSRISIKMDGESVAALVLFIYIGKDRALTLLRIGCLFTSLLITESRFFITPVLKFRLFFVLSFSSDRYYAAGYI